MHNVYVYIYVFMWQEAEGESINMQNQIDALKEEKERLLNSLVEAEWVKKSLFLLRFVVTFTQTEGKSGKIWFFP